MEKIQTFENPIGPRMESRDFTEVGINFDTMSKHSVAVLVKSCLRPPETMPNVHKHTFQKKILRAKLAI